MTDEPIAWLAPDNRIFVPNSAAGYPYGLTDESGAITEGRVSLPHGSIPLVPQQNPDLSVPDLTEMLRCARSAIDVLTRRYAGQGQA